VYYCFFVSSENILINKPETNLFGQFTKQQVLIAIFLTIRIIEASSEKIARKTNEKADDPTQPNNNNNAHRQTIRVMAIKNGDKEGCMMVRKATFIHWLVWNGRMDDAE
jgi:hypothetical protein